MPACVSGLFAICARPHGGWVWVARPVRGAQLPRPHTCPGFAGRCPQPLPGVIPSTPPRVAGARPRAPAVSPCGRDPTGRRCFLLIRNTRRVTTYTRMNPSERRCGCPCFAHDGACIPRERGVESGGGDTCVEYVPGVVDDHKSPLHGVDFMPLHEECLPT